MARALLQIGLLLIPLFSFLSITAQGPPSSRFGVRSGFFLGEPCGASNQKCLPKRSQCRNGMCECKDGYERSGNDHCIARRGILSVAASECSTDLDCKNHPDAGCALAVGSDDGFCFCKYGPSGSVCFSEPGNCTTDAECGVDGQECVTGTCQCKNNGVLHNGTCTNSGSSMPCNASTIPCPFIADGNGFSLCSDGICQCLTSSGVPGKYANVNGTLSCTEKGYSDACASSAECPANRGLTCINGHCNCFPYHRPNSAPVPERNCVYALNTCCKSSAVCGDPDLFTPPFNLTCTEGTCVMDVPGITVSQTTCVPV